MRLLSIWVAVFTPGIMIIVGYLASVGSGHAARVAVFWIGPAASTALVVWQIV